MDTLERFPCAWCDTCGKVRPVTLDVMPADEKNPHEAADIVCDECKSIIATLHAPEAQQTGASQGGRKGTRDGGPSIGPSDRAINDRRRTTNPQAKASQGTECSVIFETSAPSRNADSYRGPGEKMWRMMPPERTGAFTLACAAIQLVVALAMVFLS